MRTLKFLLVFISLPLLGFQCEDLAHSHWALRFANNSNKDVCFTVSFEQIGDKYIPSTKWPGELWKRRFVKAHSVSSFELDWDSVDTNTDSIAVFVFDPDTLCRYTWDEITRAQNCLKIYRLKYGDAPVGAGSLSYP